MFIDLETQYMRDYLQYAAAHMTSAAEALEWAEGKQTFISEELVPAFKADSEGHKAYARFIKRVQSLGPRAMRVKRAGAVGHINWGGDSKTLDKKLESLNLRKIAKDAFKAVFTNGVTAGWAYKEKGSGKDKLQLLGGYLKPLYAEGDIGGEIIGLYQVQATNTPKARYDIRVYDFAAKQIRIWRKKASATEVYASPSEIIENAPMPRVVVAEVDQEGLPLGEFATYLPLLKEEVSTQIGILRNNEAHLFAFLVLTGRFEEIKKLGPTTILKSSDTSSRAERVGGADPKGFFESQDRAIARVRDDLSLPGGFAGSQVPSGEALREANLAYLSSCNDYALLLSVFLTELVADYAELVGAKPAPVTVSVSREAMREIICAQAREDYKAGIISLRAATVAVSVYYPDWKSDQLEAFIAKEEEIPEPTVEDFAESDE